MHFQDRSVSCISASEKDRKPGADLVIPGMFYGFIQRKELQGSTGGTGQGSVLIMKIQKQTIDIKRSKRRNSVMLQQFFHCRRGETENHPKFQRSMSALHQTETKWPHLFPEGELCVLHLSLLQFLGRIVGGVEGAVDVKSTKGNKRGL